MYTEITDTHTHRKYRVIGREVTVVITVGFGKADGRGGEEHVGGRGVLIQLLRW